MRSHKARRFEALARMDEMRGRAHEKSQDEWGAYFGVSRGQIQKYLKILGEYAKGGKRTKKMPTPWVEKFSDDDLWRIEQSKKPWGNYDKMRKLWNLYMGEPGYEYLSRR